MSTSRYVTRYRKKWAPLTDEEIRATWPEWQYCRKCLRWLGVLGFSVNRSDARGRQGYCRTCNPTGAKAYMKAHKEDPVTYFLYDPSRSVVKIGHHDTILKQRLGELATGAGLSDMEVLGTIPDLPPPASSPEKQLHALFDSCRIRVKNPVTGRKYLSEWFDLGEEGSDIRIYLQEQFDWIEPCKTPPSPQTPRKASPAEPAEATELVRAAMT